MLLAVDVGNTTISLGVFEGEKLLGDWRLSTIAQRTPDELGLMMTGLLSRHIDPEKIQGAVICSVVPRLNEQLSYVFSRYFKLNPVFLNNKAGVGPAGKWMTQSRWGLIVFPIVWQGIVCLVVRC